MTRQAAEPLDNVKDDKVAVRYLEGVRRILEHGREVMTPGGSALQAVEARASLLEDGPVFYAGCGSVLTGHGKVEMDAAIMDGRDQAAGAVACVGNSTNPALLVVSEREHVMLIAEGAMRFAGQCGIGRAPDNYFCTRDRVDQPEEARLKHKIMLDHDDIEDDSEDQRYGTIGAIARDPQGKLAAATSTGGIVNTRTRRRRNRTMIFGLCSDSSRPDGRSIRLSAVNRSHRL